MKFWNKTLKSFFRLIPCLAIIFSFFLLEKNCAYAEECLEIKNNDSSLTILANSSSDVDTNSENHPLEDDSIQTDNLDKTEIINSSSNNNSDEPIIISNSNGSNTVESTEAYDGSILATGWQQAENGKWIYIDQNGNRLTGWLHLDANAYYLLPNGEMFTGGIWLEDKWYFFDPNRGGLMQKGWLDYYGSWYYMDPTDGHMLADQILTIGDYSYLLKSNGEMFTGGIWLEDKWYFFDPNRGGLMQKGWLDYYGSWYYMDPTDGHMLKGWCKDPNEDWFYLDDSGKMLSNQWLLQDGKYYYLSERGSRVTGWQKIGFSKYWFNPSNNDVMVTGFFEVDGNNYFAKSNGNVATSEWLQQNGKLYFADSDSALIIQNGSMNAVGDITLFDSNNQPISGWIEIGSGLFYATPEDGKLAKGWALIEDNWYWAAPNHVIQKGCLYVNDNWYWLSPSDGTMQIGWQFIGNDWYYFYSGGNMAIGWLQLGENRYYLCGSGSMATGWVMIDEVWQEFESNGRWIKPGERIEKDSQWLWSATPWLLVVDTANCKVAALYGNQYNWTLRYYFDCSPGKPSTPTVKGEFSVRNKGYYFDSYGARCFYWTQFYNDYLFHSVLYYPSPSPNSIMDGRLGMQLSHGCVRLHVDWAYWIYANIPQGTKVYVF